MALKFSSPPLTIFAPKSPSHRTATEIRFSRWNNANAEKFIRHERAQKEIEDDIRRQRRYESASKIAEYYEDATTTTTNTNADENEGFKSIGTPSSPSRSSIPGKSSKYSKIRNPNPNPNPNPKISHPAFSRVTKAPKISRVPIDATNGISIGENGVSYRIPNAPFEFQYSYTETPKVKPLALREPPFVPFGPSTMPRPWTGRAPLPPSKKKLPEFDSFRLPPPHKKGVKPVQAPGPFLAGMGPKLVKSREEILGETLTEEEIKALVQGCLKSRRQLNMGRDGLTHNMLDNIHAHWKRRRVCKIKCKGVCTIDMDNVRQQLEEKTGGKIIYSRGGVLFLFRGRNYNYRTRPRYPLMLWKPVTPVYPRLIQQAPEGLELEEAREMRKRGRKLPPLCKLGKNGVYSDLVKHIREAFEECELVRINCEGMNGSDHRKIGAKLKDLVPCVLISFENEHILMWRGREWKSSFSKSENECKEASESETDGATIGPPNYTNSLLEGQQETSELCAQNSSKGVATLEMPSSSMPSLDSNTLDLEGTRDLSHSASEDGSYEATDMVSSIINISESSAISETIWSTDDHSETMSMVPTTLDSMGNPNKSETIPAASRHLLGVVPASNGVITNDGPQSSSLGSHLIEVATSNSNFMEGVTLLWKQAIESGSAVVLDDTSLDANIVYNRAVTLAKGTPPGPVFKQKHRKVAVRKDVEQKTAHPEVEGIVLVSEKRIEKKSSRNQRVKDFKGIYPDILPHGSLGVDELAKLLG